MATLNMIELIIKIIFSEVVIFGIGVKLRTGTLSNLSPKKNELPNIAAIINAPNKAYPNKIINSFVVSFLFINKKNKVGYLNFIVRNS